MGISGGVDSSVSASLLKKQGYEVTGVFIRGWQPPFLECSVKEDRHSAMRVCAELGIPYLECDGALAYKKWVVDYMVDSYSKGFVPNPDVMCNKYVKFGIFYDFAIKNGADFVATGHYAQVENGILKKGIDQEKDQSYFLWAVPKEKLQKTIFPIGGMKKSEVRKIAEKNKLFTATKKDSQGLCFLGKLDVKDFLKECIDVEPGNVLNENGEIVGLHDGAMLYALGERHGFTITKKTTDDHRLYIISKDITKNTITVSNNISQNNAVKNEIIINNVNIINEEIWSNNEIKKVLVYRYHGKEIEVSAISKASECYLIQTTDLSEVLSKGQSCVLYSGDLCLGGGIIS